MKQLNLLNHIDKLNPPKITKEAKRKQRNIILKKALYLQT